MTILRESQDQWFGKAQVFDAPGFLLKIWKMKRNVQKDAFPINESTASWQTFSPELPNELSHQQGSSQDNKRQVQPPCRIHAMWGQFRGFEV